MAKTKQEKQRKLNEVNMENVAIELSASPEHLAALPWFRKLDDDTKEVVQHEHEEVVKGLHAWGRSQLAVGEHFFNIRKALARANVPFNKYLKGFYIKERNAFRLIKKYQNATKALPRPIIEAAMARNMPLLGEDEQHPLGVYTAAAKKLPPPKEPTPEKAAEWLDNLEKVRKQLRAQPATATATEEEEEESLIPQDPQELLKESYRTAALAYKKLPNNRKTRQNWIHALVGMILTEIGVSNEMSFKPTAIPDEFRRGRGRPRGSTSAPLVQ